jgi:hypothetical protein
MRGSSSRTTFLFEFNNLPSWPDLIRPPTKSRMLHYEHPAPPPFLLPAAGNFC